MVVRIFALCLTKTVVGYKEKQMLRRMLICCGLSQDLKQFTKTLELSKSGMAHAGLFCKLFDVNNGQDTSLVRILLSIHGVQPVTVTFLNTIQLQLGVRWLPSSFSPPQF